MNKIALILIIALCGCKDSTSKMDYQYNKVATKHFGAYDGWGNNDKPLPNEICEFQYIPYGFSYSVRFCDSCNKYNIGDTLK